MSINRNQINYAYGLNNPSQLLNSEPIFASRAPASDDKAQPGTVWFYQATPPEIYILSRSAGWVQIATDGGTGLFTGLTVNGTTLLNGQTTIATGTSDFNLTSSTGAINIGANSSEHTVTVGSSTGGSITNINCGTSTGSALNIAATVGMGTGGIIIGNTGSGFLSIRSNTSIGIGNDGVAKTIAIGNTTGNTAISINSGTGAINIGTSIAKNINIGNATGATTLTFNTGSGGINIPSFTTTGALVSNASGLITDANASTAGFVLTSNGAGSAPSFQAAPGGSGITDLDGDTGTATGSTVIIAGDGSNIVTSASSDTLTVSLSSNIAVDSISSLATSILVDAGLSLTVNSAQDIDITGTSTITLTTNDMQVIGGTEILLGVSTSTQLDIVEDKITSIVAPSGAATTGGIEIIYDSGSSRMKNYFGTTPSAPNSLCDIYIGSNFSDSSVNLVSGSAGINLSGNIRTNPVDSNVATPAFTTSLTAGTPVQNTTGYNILANICVRVASSTTATLIMGVSSSATPPTDTVIPSFTVAASTSFTFSAWVPHNYYLLVNSTGTISISSITVQSCAI